MLLLATALLLQDAPSLEVVCDRDAIEWVLPGDFASALERARSERRLLLVKGVSFGIDEVGATCATKGKW